MTNPKASLSSLQVSLDSRAQIPELRFPSAATLQVQHDTESGPNRHLFSSLGPSVLEARNIDYYGTIMVYFNGFPLRFLGFMGLWV